MLAIQRQGRQGGHRDDRQAGGKCQSLDDAGRDAQPGKCPRSPSECQGIQVGQAQLRDAQQAVYHGQYQFGVAPRRDLEFFFYFVVHKQRGRTGLGGGIDCQYFVT